MEANSSLLQMYRKSLGLIRMIDRIRDEHEELRDILRHSLKVLNSELECLTAFVQYYDVYEESQSLAIDRNGLVTRHLDTAIEDFAGTIGDVEKSVFPDKRMVGGHFVITPLRLNEKRVGILGAEFNLAPEEPDAILMECIAVILDTAINQKCKEAFLEDQRNAMQAMDEIIDRNLDDFSTCREKILVEISRISGAAGTFLFEGSESDPFRLLAANDLARVAWEEYPDIVMAIKQIVQESIQKEKPDIQVFQDDPRLRVASSQIHTVGAFPLITASGYSGGILAVMSYVPIAEARIALIEAACRVLDTNLIQGKRADAMVRRYRKHVGNDVTTMLLENPEWLKPRRETVVVLSADLVGATTFASREPDAVKTFDLVNRYLTMIAGIITDDFNGTLDKFIGDEIMALFGAPVRDHKAPYTAAKCALAIRESVMRYNKSAIDAGRPYFDVKITLGSVEAIVGEVGSEEYQTDYTALGEGVKNVFRMTPFGRPNQIMINDALKAHIEDQFTVEHAGNVDMGAGGEPTTMYRLLMRKS